MKNIFLCLILLFANYLLAQNHQVLDSLKLEIEIANTPSKRIDLLINASGVAIELQLLEESQSLLTEALNIARDKGFIEEQIEVMSDLASVYFEQDDFKNSFAFANQAKELADKNEFEVESAEISQFLAQLFFVLGEYDKSVNLSFSALKKLEELKDEIRLSESLEMIGRNYLVKGQDSLGTDYLLKAIDLARTHDNHVTLGVAMINLSNSYYINQQSRKAINLLKEGCDLLLSYKNTAPAIGIGYTNVALNYLSISELDSTLLYLNKAKAFNIKINNSRNLLNTHNAYAYYYQKINDDQNFIKSANKAYSISDDNNFRLEKQTISRLLEEYYVTKQIDSAYKYSKIQRDISEVINSQNTLTKMAQLEMMKELEIVEKEKLLEKRRRTLISIVVLTVLVSLIIVFFVLFNNYKTKVRYSNLKQKKLEDDISYKSKEMTIQLMDLTKRNELLAVVTQKLIKVSKDAQKVETKNAINKIAVDIKKATEGKIWEDFIVRFKEVHSDFYKNLLERFPDLSPNEQRLCAFLKLNLSTKEISSMTGQSDRSIVMARHRLRKKLGIESQETNLTTFISKV